MRASGGAPERRRPDGRSRRAGRIARRLAAASCLSFCVAAVMLVLILGQTDSGLHCSGTADPGPAACAVYDAWSVPLVLSVATGVGALVSWAVALLPRR